MTSARRKILIAGMGTSPAVLTNAVWALAHQEKAKASLKESLDRAARSFGIILLS